ncbi:Lipoteichoic acid synthase 1 [uncultured Ruminococcus sp.]|nr:Lipoteichoic acid synthase 1 [uncultured Ruminococcus sp.]
MSKKKKVIMIVKGVGLLVSTIAMLLCFSIKWMFDTWANLTMDELIYHLKAPLEGTNEDMIWDYILKCILPTIIIFIIVYVIMKMINKKGKKNGKFLGVICVVSIGVMCISIYNVWTKLDVGEYISGQNEFSTFIDDNYVDPRDVDIVFPEKKRNLIYIFLESMETTYTDEKNGGAFEENVIPELTKLAQENEDFSGKSKKLNGGYSLTGSTWTMGAMFAQTSGLPLKISISANEMDTQKSFFPGIVTIGDILGDAGYSQTLMIGSDATFGGRRLYFTDHGNYDIFDYNYAAQQGMLSDEYPVWWGYDDQKLFEFAKEKLNELSAQDEPFNLTMLTVDTHFEDGYVCDKCDDKFGDNQYANVMACSSKQVKEFVEWVKQQDFYEDTTIVISGDHPTMDSDFCENVDENYGRRVYTAYINASDSPKSSMTRTYTTFDNFPTTLAAMGVTIEGNRLGLGTNLFSSEQTLSERYGLENEEKEMKKNSEFMIELANIDESSESLLIREGIIPTGQMTVGEYQTETGIIPVSIQNITGGDNIQAINIAVWKKEDQSDLQWIEMQYQEDESYVADIDMSNFDYEQGEYNIHAYAITNDGEQYFIGGGMGYKQ